MSLTINESGEALAETQEGVTMPIDCSFEKVNGWIHGTDVHFEEIQALCLGMSSENDKLRKALSDIKRNQEFVGDGLASMGAVWTIADQALKAN